MAAKAWSSQQKAVDEVFFQNDAVSLCLLINRRAKTMRVVDFRAGPTLAKRKLVLELAKREGMEKVYTLVERDELSTWVKLGFAKEGNIPGFYKRSDAFLLGCSVDAALAREPREVPMQSEVRISLRDQADAGSADAVPSAIEDEEPVELVDDSAHLFAEKTLAHAKKQAKDLADKPLPVAKVAPLREADVKKPLEKALKAGRALTAFEPFGRDVERRYFIATCRPPKSPVFELIASTESQACFGNAFLELLTAPRSEVEKLAAIVGAPRSVRTPPRRGRRELLLARTERRRGALLRVRGERLPADGAPAEPHGGRRPSARTRSSGRGSSRIRRTSKRTFSHAYTTHLLRLNMPAA